MPAEEGFCSSFAGVFCGCLSSVKFTDEIIIPRLQLHVFLSVPTKLNDLQKARRSNQFCTKNDVKLISREAVERKQFAWSDHNILDSHLHLLDNYAIMETVLRL